MHIEINDPRDCTFIHQPPGAQLHPSAEQARECPQCQQSTWAHTARCMWCGHDRHARPVRLAIIAALCLGGIALGARIWHPWV